MDGCNENRAETHAMPAIVLQSPEEKRYNSYRAERGKVSPNVLNRELNTDDVTEFSVGDRKLYLSPIVISSTGKSSPTRSDSRRTRN